MNRPKPRRDDLAGYAFAVVPLSELPIDGAGAKPLQLFRWGINAPVDGRPPVTIDEAWADACESAFARRTVELAIDYNHASLFGFADTPAAGWIAALACVRPAPGQQPLPDVHGVWITPDWTPAGRERVKAREYRYMSAVLRRDFDTGATLPEVLGAALTNSPAIHGLAEAVAASEQRTSAEPGADREGPMQELLKKLGFPSVEALETALGELKTTAAQVEPLTAQLTEAKGKVEALSAENATLRVERAVALAKAAGKGSELELAFARRIAGDEQAFSAWLAIPVPAPTSAAPQPPTTPLNPAPPGGAEALSALAQGADPERAKLAGDVAAYAREHKCGTGEAYEAVTAAQKVR